MLLSYMANIAPPSFSEPSCYVIKHTLLLLILDKREYPSGLSFDILYYMVPS